MINCYYVQSFLWRSEEHEATCVWNSEKGANVWKHRGEIPAELFKSKLQLCWLMPSMKASWSCSHSTWQKYELLMYAAGRLGGGVCAERNNLGFRVYLMRQAKPGGGALHPNTWRDESSSARLHPPHHVSTLKQWPALPQTPHSFKLQSPKEGSLCRTPTPPGLFCQGLPEQHHAQAQQSRGCREPEQEAWHSCWASMDTRVKPPPAPGHPEQDGGDPDHHPIQNQPHPSLYMDRSVQTYLCKRPWSMICCYSVVPQNKNIFKKISPR